MPECFGSWLAGILQAFRVSECGDKSSQVGAMKDDRSVGVCDAAVLYFGWAGGEADGGDRGGFGEW